MNRLMKQYARKLYLGRMGFLYLAAAVCLLLQMGAMLLPDLLADLLPVYSDTLLPSLLGLVALGPLGVGFLRVCYQVYLGQEAGFAQLFYYFTSPGRYGKAVAVTLLRDLAQYLLLPLAQLVARLGARTAESYRPADLALTLGAALLLLVLAVVAVFWLLRMVLLPYLLIRDESAGMGHLLKESFRLMGGNVGRYLGLIFSFLGYYLLTALAYGIASAAITLTLGPGDPLALITLPQLLEEALLYLLLAILEPYLALSVVGFADTVLSGRMEEVRHRASLGGRFLSWEQLHWEMARGIPPSAPGMAYPGGPVGGPYGAPPTPYGQPPAPPPWQPPQPPQGADPRRQEMPAPSPARAPRFSPQELQTQQNLFLLEQPMAPQRFFASGMTPSYYNLTLDSLLPDSGVYPFLGQDARLLELVDTTWRACQQQMNAQPPGVGRLAHQQHRRTVRGTPIRVTATIQEQQDGAGYQVGLGVELSPQG